MQLYNKTLSGFVKNKVNFSLIKKAVYYYTHKESFKIPSPRHHVRKILEF